MSEIVNKMQQEIINRSNNFEEQTRGTKDEYNIYREHIQYVYKYVCLLSKGKNVDYEVLELSALLHDIAMTDRALDRSKHNEYGSVIAEQLLRENNYPEDKIQFVKKCILNHRGSRLVDKTSPEEICIADSDAMAHFYSIPSLLSMVYKEKGLSIDDGSKFVMDKLDRSYNKMSDKGKVLVKVQYESAKNILKF